MTDQPTRTLAEEQDARHAELERTASEAIRTGRLTVSVPAIDLLTAMATLGAYRDLAGLGDRIPAREPSPIECARCGLAWRIDERLWVGSSATPSWCDHVTADGKR